METVCGIAALCAFPVADRFFAGFCNRHRAGTAGFAGTTETTSQPAAPTTGSSETEYPSAEQSGENRIVLIGILAWVGFLVVVGVVAVIVVKSKRRPPGGGSGSGRLGESSPGNEGYKERILSDQHYRKY